MTQSHELCIMCGGGKCSQRMQRAWSYEFPVRPLHSFSMINFPAATTIVWEDPHLEKLQLDKKLIRQKYNQGDLHDLTSACR